VPVLGQQMVLGRIIRGDDVPLVDYVVPAALALAIAAASIAALTRLLDDERIVFGRS